MIVWTHQVTTRNKQNNYDTKNLMCRVPKCDAVWVNGISWYQVNKYRSHVTLLLCMHQVNIGKIQEPISPNFKICYIPDYYLMHSHVLATYHIRAAALGNPQVVVQRSEDAGAGVVLASLWEWSAYPGEREINPLNTKSVFVLLTQRMSIMTNALTYT